MHIRAQVIDVLESIIEEGLDDCCSVVAFNQWARQIHQLLLTVVFLGSDERDASSYFSFTIVTPSPPSLRSPGRKEAT